jgi:hypothetical protein
MMCRSKHTFDGETKHFEHVYRIVHILISLVFLLITGDAFGQQKNGTKTIIFGTVTDKSGQSLELVHLQIKGSATGAVSDEAGAFSITTDKTGEHILAASLVGYKTEEIKVDLEPGNKLQIPITLNERIAEIEEVQVSASSFRTGEAEGVTLNPLEVVTTPGAAADLFQALQTFPGVNAVDEGSGLFVRGGDVSETKILLDQATVVHPYRFESPTGGTRGTIPPFLVSGTYFSTGGFPARYGNALSAVLSLESENMPQATTVDLNLGMAAASAGISAPLIDDKLGIRFTGNRSFTRFLFEINGQADEFQKAPLGLDGNLSLIYKPSSGSTLKFFNFASRSEIGVRTDEPSFDGLFNSDETNRLHNLQWEQYLGDWVMETSFSVNRFNSQSELGGFNLTQKDDTHKFRTDFESLFSNSLQLFFGGEWESVQNSFAGSLPDQDNVFDPDADFTNLDETFRAGRIAAWAEIEFQISPKIQTNIGLRSDLWTESRETVFDPRFTVLYRFDKNTTLRAATGLYHQFPEPFQFNGETGNPDLEPQRALHYILGLDHKKEMLHLRFEGYYKDYEELVIDANDDNLSNRGYGHVRGVDFFVKYSEYLKTRFNGWISYSFLQSDRFQARDLGNRFDFDLAPSDFDITHNLNVVGKMRLINTLYFGARYRFASGRPVTPVTGARFIEEAGFYQPVEGAVNSLRLPNSHRLDMDISYYWPFTPGKAATFYVSVSNALNRNNITNFTYNQDYSQRRPVFSNFSRSVYAGVSVNLGL